MAYSVTSIQVQEIPLISLTAGTTNAAATRSERSLLILQIFGTIDFPITNFTVTLPADHPLFPNMVVAFVASTHAIAVSLNAAICSGGMPHFSTSTNSGGRTIGPAYSNSSDLIYVATIDPAQYNSGTTNFIFSVTGLKVI